MTTYVLMAHPAYHQDEILGGNGVGVTQAIQLARVAAGIAGEPVEIHGFAGKDFLADLQAAAPGMGASCHVIGCEGLTRIDRIISTGNGTEHLDKNHRWDSYVVLEHEFYRMRDQLLSRLRPGDTLLITGSRPAWDYADFTVDWNRLTYELFVGIAEWAQHHGVYVAFDAPPRNPDKFEDPPGPLELMFASHVRPDLAKMNSTEWNAVTAQYLAHHRDFADEIAHLGVNSPEWRTLVASRLMPRGFLVVSYGQRIFAYLNGRATVHKLKAPSWYAKRWVTSVGRGDTVMGTLLALRRHPKGVLWALKRALAARAAQTFHLKPGFYATDDAAKLRKDIELEFDTTVTVEQGQRMPA